MKKFLSLVLALVMAMSLVTISAGATEYKNLTDKSTITYSEAVAVLNKLGIITGYEDGSFKPAATLTRGAAAKIICSLMIGSDAANALSVTASPYKDVPANNTFAAYISFCKTAGYINGYSDGTYHPAEALTGYAFAKMLLGALGYDGSVEGFTGVGWTMNVAKLGNKAGLFNGISGFTGSVTVSREVACQLALNTLKANEVEYTGNNVSVTTGSATVVVGNNKYYDVTSSNTNINSNIVANDGVLQFGEEHFTSLKLASTSATDSFGRPANQWSYKNVTIGTYGKTPSYVYTSSMVKSSDNDATKVSKLGLTGYSVANNALIYTNGSAVSTALTSVAAIGALTANGTRVEVYTSSSVADTITAVVVVKTQLMQVNTVSSAAVTMKQIEGTGVAVNAVKSDSDNYAALSAMKADDYVLVTPVKATGDTTYSIDSFVAPTVVTGSISSVALSGSSVSGITMNGTAYNMSALWSSKDGSLTSTSANTKVTSTAYLDSYGYAIYVKDVTATTNYIALASIYSSLVNGKIVSIANGYDMSGASVQLNLGTVSTGSFVVGTVYAYAPTTDSSADYVMTGMTGTQGGSYTSSGSASRVVIDNGAISLNGKYFASNVKFLFETWNDAGTVVNSVTVKDGVQKISAPTAADYVLQYVLNKDGNISTVIVKEDSNVSVGANVLFVSKLTGATTDASGKQVSIFTAYIDGVETTNCVATKAISAPGFYTYAVGSDGIYTLQSYSTQSGKATSIVNNVLLAKNSIINKTYIMGLTGTALKADGATIIDLSGGNNGFTTLKQLAESAYTNFTVSLVYNDSDTGAKGTVSYIFVLDHDVNTSIYALTAQTSGIKFYSDAACTTEITSALYGTTVYAQATAVNVTIAEGSASITDMVSVVNAGASVKNIVSFTMPASALAVGDFTEA